MKKSLHRLTVATFISDFGSSLTLAALPVLFLKLGKPNGVGIYNLWFAAGSTIGCFFAIGIIDQFKKNKVAAVTDIIRALLMIPLIIQPSPSMLIMVVYAITHGLFGSTTSGAIQSWITDHNFSTADLKIANSKTEIASQLGNGIGPFVGVLIATTFGLSAVFLIDAATYLIGAILVYGLESKTPVSKKQTALNEIIEGFAYVTKNKYMKNWIFVSLFHCVGFAAINTVYVKILDTKTSASDSQLFIFQSAYFIGSLLGGLGALRTTNNTPALFKIFSLLLSVLMVCNIFATNYYLLFLLAALQSLSRVITVISTRTIVGSLSSDHFTGRVMLFRLGVINIGLTLAYIIIVPLSSTVGISATLLIGAFFFLSSIFPVIKYKSV